MLSLQQRLRRIAGYKNRNTLSRDGIPFDVPMSTRPRRAISEESADFGLLHFLYICTSVWQKVNV